MKTTQFFVASLLALLTNGFCPAFASGDGNGHVSEYDQMWQDASFWKSIYEQNHVIEIDISLTEEAWEAMQPAQDAREERGPRDGDRAERTRPGSEAGRPEGPPPGRGGGDRGETGFEYARADITVDGKLLGEAGLRFKGNSSYRFSSNGYKRPLKIDTNRFVDGQKLHGRTKFNLSTAFLDPAYMKEKLAYEIYQAAGIPTPGTGWAKVTLSIAGKLDRKFLGIYVVVEQVDSNYLARQFGKKTKDSLLMKPEGSTDWQYPGSDVERYKEAFDIKAGEDNGDQIRQFGDFLSSIKDAPDSGFAREIGERLDLDLFAGYLAATCLLSSIDSYVGAPHNYYLLVDKADDKVRLLPWDVNEAFGTFSMGFSPNLLPDWDIDRPWVSSINTDFHTVFTKAEVRENVASATPLKREGDAEDVANLVAYLASDEAAFITGACVDINGGLLFS